MQQLLITSFDQYEQLIPPGGRDICAFPPDFHFLEPWRGGVVPSKFQCFLHRRIYLITQSPTLSDRSHLHIKHRTINPANDTASVTWLQPQ